MTRCWWLVAALCLGGIFGLAVARYASSPAWLDGLIAAGACFGLTFGVAAGILLRRLRRPRPWLSLAGLTLALAAAATRSVLVHEALDGNWPRPIDFWAVMLASATVAWGGLALVWAAAAVDQALQRGNPIFSRRSDAILHLVAGAIGVSVALYSVAPLWHLLGLVVSSWTLVGLFSLAAAAYGLGAAYRWAAARLGAGHRK